MNVASTAILRHAFVAVIAAGCVRAEVAPEIEPEAPPLAVASAATCAKPQPFAESGLRADVTFLASPKLAGRFPGSPGDAAARDFVASRFACLGLSALGAQGSFQQSFEDDDGHPTANVLAALKGADPDVAKEIVLVSAHIDHFGGGKLGANDDASGVAALLAAADALQAKTVRPRRTIVFAVFGAEESGFEGSQYFVAHSPAGIDPARIVYNVNLDMVGTYAQAQTLEALGTFAGTPGRAAVEAYSNAHAGFDITLGNDSDQSDHVTFCSRGVPYVFLWTEDEQCYHQSCDTAERLDYVGLSHAAALTAHVAASLADSPADLAGEVKVGQNVCAGGGKRRK